jgi:hypothetical protein
MAYRFTITGLIARLEALKAEHGDVPVLVDGVSGDRDIALVSFDDTCDERVVVIEGDGVDMG